MANLYYDFAPSSHLKPYLGLGLGAPTEDINATAGMTTVETSDPDGTAWNLMVGASYRIHDRIEFTFGYRYLGVFAELDYMQFNEFLIGVRYNF
jgi:outer membrane autotransporter protein